MNRIQNILQFKSIVLGIGLVMAVAVITNPIYKNYTVKIDQISKVQESEQSKEDKNPTTVIAEFQAITPVAQFDFQDGNFILENLAIEFQVVQGKIVSLVQKTSEKLFKILFRLIISPNAP